MVIALFPDPDSILGFIVFVLWIRIGRPWMPIRIRLNDVDPTGSGPITLNFETLQSANLLFGAVPPFILMLVYCIA